jgi:hypothetical protein
MSDDGSAVIAKWDRDKTRREDADRSAKSSMKKVIAAAMREGSTKKNIAKELLDARRGGAKPINREGYGDDDEVITGNPGERPWERE